MPDRSTPEILRLDAAPPPEPEPILTWVNRSHNGAGTRLRRASNDRNRAQS